MSTALTAIEVYVLYAGTDVFETFLKVLTVAGAFHNSIEDICEMNLDFDKGW